MLAYQQINELEIYCANRHCMWKGPLENITMHLPKCSYSTGVLPKWMSDYLKSKEGEFVAEEDR